MMTNHVCPWWGGYFIDNPLRRLLHDPTKIVGPYVRPGMSVLDVGCGMGWFSIPMARWVGDQGRVLAVDLQQQMLDVLRRRAASAGVAHRIDTQLCLQDHLGLNGPSQFQEVRHDLEPPPEGWRRGSHSPESVQLHLEVQVDFALAFAMVHEVPDQRRLLGEIRDCLKPGGKLLVAEPKIHVPGKMFADTVQTAESLGLRAVEEPCVRWCRAVVFCKE